MLCHDYPMIKRNDFVILGASGTTGRLIADHLVRQGASVVLAGRDTARLGETAARFGGAAVSVLAVDMADPGSLARAAQAGRVLVNTVGPFARLAPSVVAAAGPRLSRTGTASCRRGLAGRTRRHGTDRAWPPS